MKELFEDLKMHLYNTREHFVFEDVDGELQFDGEAMYAEIDAFAEQFMARLN